MAEIKLSTKNVSKKKMIIYFIIVCILVISIVFYIYKTSNIAPEETAVSEDFISRVSTELTKTIRPLDISIFNSSKFKILKEIIFKEVKVKAGRENPFKDPFEISH